MGVVIASLIAVLMAGGIYGGAFYRFSPAEDRRLLWFAFLSTLPMCLLAFYAVRIPLLEVVNPQLEGNPLNTWIKLLYAPLTEEPAKLLPFLIPWFRRQVTAENAIRVGYALGLGFGIGEIALVGWFTYSDPDLAKLAWWQLGGLTSERFFVCLIHGLFTGVVLCAWKRWKLGFLGGLTLGMLLHLLANFPIVATRQISGLAGSSAIICFYWVIAFWFAALWFYARKQGRSSKTIGEMLFGVARCPKCDNEYPRPLWGLNLGPKRYEKCPHCHKWNLL